MSQQSPNLSFPADMRWSLLDGKFALVGFSEMPSSRALELLLESRGGQMIREGGETTLLLPMESLAKLESMHPSMRVERDLNWYRFESPMSWDVVGFLALVTSKLAEADVPVCAICAYSRDYLLIADPFEAVVREVLARLFPEAH
jgi:hypothetical protein